MPWGRLDDSLYDHPKLDRIPVEQRLAAIGLWARAISWCNRFLTDGHVPRGRLEKLDGTAELADLLVGAGLFDDVPTGYEVHDFLEFNDSRADVLERREKEAQRQRDWRKRKAEARNGVTPSVTEADVTPVVTAVVTPSVTPVVTGIPARASRSANPGPARPGPVVRERATRSSTSGARAASGEAALLTKGQLDAWATFGPEWTHFKAAWLERGFKHPPSGDPGGDDTSQRGLLWQVLDARPTGIAEWVRAAPRGATARAVVQYVLDRFHEVRASVSDEPIERGVAPTRQEAAETVGAIMSRLADPAWLTKAPGGLESSEAAAGIEPHGSHEPGRTGSNAQGSSS